MSGDQDAAVAAEEHVRQVSDELTTPRAQECLLCYLQRMVHQFNCDGTLRWSQRWGHSQRPKRFSRKRLERGGGYCDCEVIMNVFRAELPALQDVNDPCRHLSAGSAS